MGRILIILSALFASNLYAVANIPDMPGCSITEEFKNKNKACFASESREEYLDNCQELETPGKNNSLAQVLIGSQYETGRLVPKNYETAIKWYEEASKNGCSVGAVNLASLYARKFNGTGKSFFWRVEAAKLGHVISQYTVGMFYQFGHGEVKEDLSKAKKWYKKAAKNNHVDSQVSLGNIYRIEKSYTKAVKWYKKAVDQGDARAQVLYGAMYAEGFGVTKSGKKAIELFKLAAEQNNDLAQFNLGKAYAGGRLVVQNYEKAFFWYKRSAGHGYVKSQVELSIMYALGKVEKNIVLAHMWANVASTTDEKNIEWRDILAEQMTREQIQEAQDLASNWVANVY